MTATQKQNEDVLSKWMTYDEVKELFNYKATQMSSLIKHFVVSKIGKRKFILRDSVDKFLSKNIM